MLTDQQLVLKSLRYRRKIIEVVKHVGAGHTGGDLSCTDILNVLYNRILRVSPATFSDPKRDRYVQSKGHCAEALFTVLADCGFFPEADLLTMCQYQSHYVGHPTRHIPGVEQNTGGLGHGLPMCVGMAIAAKLDAADWRVFTLLGDGELAEGSNWEAAMAAAHYKLSGLTAVIDCNTLQISGRTRDVMSNEPLAEKFAAFGWAVRTIDGHSITELTDALKAPLASDKPSVVIARTVKGKGVSFMEDIAKWHHGVPSDEEYKQALTELDLALAKQGGTTQ